MFELFRNEDDADAVTCDFGSVKVECPCWAARFICHVACGQGQESAQVASHQPALTIWAISSVINGSTVVAVVCL